MDLPAKALRLRALRGAYLDTLAAACQRLEVSSPPRGDRVPQAEIYRAEAALRQRGLDVTETAAPAVPPIGEAQACLQDWS